MSKPLLSVNPSEAIELGAADLLAYGRLFHPRTFRQGFAPFHREMADALYSPDRLNEFLCFRGSAKTTLLRGFTSQRIAYGISRTIMYVSSSQGHAIHSVRWMKYQIETNHRLKLFKLRPGSKWTDEWIQIVHEIEEIEINLFAVGVTGQTRGFNIDDYRPDLIIGDDILDDENTATEEQREKVKDRWDGSLMKSLAPRSEAPYAKAILAQTPFNNNDLSMVNSRDPAYNCRIFSCFDENGRSRWEERFPTEELLAQKASDTARGRYHVWMREMECKVVLADKKPFDVTKLRFWDDLGLPEGARKIMAIDPASSESHKADQNVVGVVYQKGHDFYLAAFDAATGVMPDKCWNTARSYWLAHPGLMGCTVETNGYQRVLKWYFEQQMIATRQFFPVIPVESKTNKADRIVTSLSSILNFGHLWVHSSMTSFVEQMDNYNPDEKKPKDDILDMTSMAIIQLNPALGHLATASGETYEGMATIIEDESMYEELNFGGCP